MKELTIHEIRDIQISILKQLKHYCDQNNLKYYLAYGTLIGAVRHQGFIPWDDDIDVVMARGDYEKLIKDYNRGVGITEIREIRTDPAYIYPYAKLCRKDTVLLEKGVKCPAPLGINIDIFPLDNYMNNKALIFKLFVYRKCLTVKVSKFSSAARGLFKNILFLAAKIPLLCFSRTFFLKNIDKCARRYAERTTVYAANLVDICSYKKIYHKRIFAAVKAHVFEDAYYNIPDGYDEFLKITYGDYMKIPDASQQKTNHNFMAYLK